MTSRMRRRRARIRRREAETVVEQGAPVVEEEEVVPPPPPPPRPLLWPWLLLLLLLVIGGLVALWLLTRDDGNESASTVVVPNVVRLTQQEAVARVSRKGLVARISTRPSPTPAGIVVAEDPGPGSQVTRRSVVTLTVSAAQTVAVPSVVGMRTAQAIRTLQAKGFQIQTANVVSKKPPGTVLGQSPAAGTSVARGSTVIVRVSRGLVTVPNVVGQSRDDAVQTVRGAGLVPKAFGVPSTQPKGTVVAQTPPAGKRVPGGTPVRLNVSNGQRSSGGPPPPPPPPPASASVPDVTGLPQAAAQSRLNAAGLKAGVVYVPSDETQGTVVSQSPQANTTPKRGTRIQLNVSLGPTPGEQRAVPDVLGQDPAAARARLQAAGFKVQLLVQQVTARSEVGKIVDEQPGGGKQAPAGSTVVIYVGRA